MERRSGRSAPGGLAQRKDPLLDEVPEPREPWLAVSSAGVTTFGRTFSWTKVGGFAMQGALLYLLWVNIREGPEAFGEPRSAS